jgi:hypothetical protein
MHEKYCIISIQYETDSAEPVIPEGEGNQMLQDRYMTKCKNLQVPSL